MVMWYKSVSFWKQALVTLAAATGMFNWGTVLGWSNIANPQLRSNETGFGMGDEGSSWIGSTVPFGGIVGSLFGGTMMDMVGRKRSLIFAHFVGLVGWITIALAQSVWVICVGRFFCGYSSATTALVATVYVGEVVISEHRGLFCSCLACAVSIGIQFVVAIGSIIPTWQMTTVVCMIPVLIGITILPFMPESPYFLAWKSGNVEDARPSLNWILHHKTEKVETTLEDIGEYLQTVHQEEANSKQNKNENDEDAGNHEKDLKSDEFQIDSPQPKRGKFSKLNLFEIKMILIGSVLMMFSRINAATGMFNWGTVVGWSNIATPLLRNNVTGFGIDDEGSSWIGSTVPFGGILGSLLGGKLMDLIGRKSSLIGAHIISLIGWIIIASGDSVLVICIGRFLCGYASASTVLIATVYVSEIVESDHRGLFGSCLACAMSIGLQYVVGLGAVITSWQLSAVACIPPIILGIIMTPFMPESPYFLAWKSGKIEAARPSLNWVLNNNSEKIEKTLKDIKEYLIQTFTQEVGGQEHINLGFEENEFELPSINQTGTLETIKLNQPIKKKLTLFDAKMIFIGSALMIFSKINGVPSLDYYMIEIFEASSMKFNYNVAAIIVRMAEIISTFLALYMTDRMGRKFLLLLSGLGMAVGMATLGAGFSVMDENKQVPNVALSYLPLIGMVIFYLTFPIGFNAALLVLLGELFSPTIKGVATSVSTVVWWTSEFVTAKIYFDCTYVLGMAGTFYMYSVISLIAVIIVHIFVRETKNKTLAEIQEIFKAKRL